MVARETILLGNQYVQHVSVVLCLTSKDIIAEWVHGKHWKGKKESPKILTSMKKIWITYSYSYEAEKNLRK